MNTENKKVWIKPNPPKRIGLNTPEGKANGNSVNEINDPYFQIGPS